MTRTADPLAWTLRDATERDRPFLRTLYADTHGSDFDAADLSADGQELLVGHQFAIRERAFTAQPGVRSSIVVVAGRPVGRLLVSDDGRQLQLTDIALLGLHRGRGIGTALVSGLVAEADERGLPIELHVELGNPAQRLYERLGFAPIGQDTFRIRMRRETRGARSAAPPVQSAPSPGGPS